VCTCRGSCLNVGTGLDAACRHEGQVVAQRFPHDLARTLGVDLERAQVAAVHGDDAGAHTKRDREFLGRGDLHKRRHAERLRDVCVVARHVPEHAHHEQHGVGSVTARHEELHGVDDEVLTEHRDVDRVGYVGQVAERAAEVLRLGEHADGCRSAVLVMERLLARFALGGDGTDTRRGLLDLRDDGDVGAVAQGGREVTRRTGAAREALAVGGGEPSVLGLDAVAPLAHHGLEEVHALASPAAAARSRASAASR